MRILFLCLGNICRSPAAEGVFRARAERAGLRVTLDSAGTGDWHVGEAPYAAMQQAARRRGYELSGLRARQLATEDFHRFDLILAMDRQNLEDARALAPQGAPAQIALFLSETGSEGNDRGRHGAEVPDPYYTREFDACLDIIEAGADRLLARLLSERPQTGQIASDRIDTDRTGRP